MIAQNSGLLHWLVGDRPDRAGTPALQWANLPESWGVFVLLAIVGVICYAVFWMYRREINTCPMPVKLAMAVMRLAVLLLFLLLYLKPSLYFQKIDEVRQPIECLRDISLSLDRGDKYQSEEQVKRLAKLTGADAAAIAEGSVSRSDLLNKAFAKHPELLEKFRERGPVRVVDFSDGSKSLELIPSLTKEEREKEDTPKEESEQETLVFKFPELQPSGSATDIWQALKTVLDGSSPPAAIVLVSEGQHNGSEDPLEMARRAGIMGIPIYTIGVGDPNPPKNISVSDVFVRSEAYPNEPFEVEAIIQTSGRSETNLPGSLRVTLLQQSVGQDGQLDTPVEIQTRDIPVPENSNRIRLDFAHSGLPQPGDYQYTVRCETFPDETQTDDNEALAPKLLKILDDDVRVLLVSGLPSWDYQQVYKLLWRDPNIHVSSWLQSLDETRSQPGNNEYVINRLPTTLPELLEFDVIMLLDPNPIEFDEQWVQLLKDYCKVNGRGLLYMAGPQFTSEFFTKPSLDGFRELVPVTFGDLEEVRFKEKLAEATDDSAGKMLTVPYNMQHPVMSFRAESEENQRTWSKMPGIYWSFPALEAKPTASVLMERGDLVSAKGNQPLMVAGRYGAGSVLYFGFQGTWRWRPVGLQAQFFERFWIQVVRFLVKTGARGERRGSINHEKSEYELGERITLISKLLNEEYQPETRDNIEVVVQSAEDGRQQKVLLKRLPKQNGQYEGVFPASRVGSYTAKIDWGKNSKGEELVKSANFKVVSPSAELGSYWLNEKLMRDISSQSGGKYFRLDSIEQLPAELPNTVDKFTRNSPPEPLWDASWLLRMSVFLLPVILLTIEWACRKWYKLL